MALISVSPFARQSKKQPFTLMKLSKHMLVECQFLRGRELETGIAEAIT